ncbi:unnamed protein product, partial [Polarella glacialis]
MACSTAGGITLDGSGSYVSYGSWTWGGVTTLEAYVQLTSLAESQSVFDCASGEGRLSNDVALTASNDSALHVLVSTASINSNNDNNDNNNNNDAGLTTRVSSPSFWPTSTWVHVVVTMDGPQVTIYKDGALEQQLSSGQQPDRARRSHCYTGKSNVGTDAFLTGSIAYVRMWNGVAVNTSEVAMLYAHRQDCSTYTCGTNCGNGECYSDQRLISSASQIAGQSDVLCCEHVCSEHECRSGDQLKSNASSLYGQRGTDCCEIASTTSMSSTTTTKTATATTSST